MQESFKEGATLEYVHIEARMKTVGVRAFRKNLAAYLEKGEPLAVTRNGRTLGFLLPTTRKTSAQPEVPAPRKSTGEEKRALDKAATRLRKKFAEHCVTGEELIEEFERRRAEEKRKRLRETDPL